MEEIMKKEITLIKNSYYNNLKLIIPNEVEKKIRFTCQQIWDFEWSGVLFFNYSGSFENNDLVITCVDFYVMDIGNTTYTEFDMSPNVISYMAEHHELLNCQIGLIHSHDNMPTFFSGTDVNTLKEEGADRNNFVSLIVNNAGNYTAAITRKISSVKTNSTINYEFFGEGNRIETVVEDNNDDIQIEYFYLNIVKDTEKYNFTELDCRIKELKAIKESSKENKINFTSNTLVSDTSSKQIEIPTTDNNLFEYSEFDFDNKDIDLVNKDLLKSLLLQLLSGSILLLDSNIDINKLANSMQNLYTKRFGDMEDSVNESTFDTWAQMYIDFIVSSITDQQLFDLGYSNYDIMSLYACNLIDELRKLPENFFINKYIEILNDYTEYGK